MNTDIYIDDENRQKLINSIQTYTTLSVLINVPLTIAEYTATNIILYKKTPEIHSQLKNIQLFPNVLVDMINEYVIEVINVQIKINNKSCVFLKIECNDNLLFRGYLYVNPKRRHLQLDNCMSYYFNDQIDKVCASDCILKCEILFIFNKFMEYYYNIPKHIDDGNWHDCEYPHYYFKDEYLINQKIDCQHMLKDKKLFEKTIISMKIIIDIIVEHCKDLYNK